MIELDDIQHILLTRTPALTGRYYFVSFASAEAGRCWLGELLDVVRSARVAERRGVEEKRWVTVAVTWNGQRALGVDVPS
ncbi:MAG: peroxidase, partial [Gemmatimonadaceae bacterium]